MSENLLNAIHYFRIPVIDLKQSVAWYTECLDFQLQFSRDGFAVLALKAGPLFVLVEADKDSRGHFTIDGLPEFSVGFTTSRIQSLHYHLSNLGVEVDPIQEDEGHNYFCFYDPSGNKLQVHD